MPSTSTDDTEIIANIRDMLVHLGENPDRPGMEKTPKRFLDALKFATSGYNQSLDEIVNDALFPLESLGERNMIMVRDIQIYSMCEHHLLPFHGISHIAYIPTKNVLGLSKVARIAEMFARRFQIQERLTDQIASAIAEACAPLGVGVVIHAEHMCMTMRGVQKPGSITTTSSLFGCFRSDPRTRQEFLTLAGAYRK